MIGERSCGVDIQVYSPTVERIAARFLSSEEEKSFVKGNRNHALHILWGAKESMYKAYGKKKLEFRSHIFIKDMDFALCTGTGEIAYEGIHLRYDLHFRLLPEAAWVFCVLHNDAVLPHTI
jgi:phosphopantetheinyl transferase (holo-ACP synthase)